MSANDLLLRTCSPVLAAFPRRYSPGSNHLHMQVRTVAEGIGVSVEMSISPVHPLFQRD